MTRTLVTAIVSTALPGAARGALDAAIELGLGHGGWRHAELEVPEIYAAHQRTTTSAGLATRLNVQDSDGTLIVTAGPPPLDGRTKFVAEACRAQRKPAKHIQLTAGDRTRVPDAVRTALLAWIDDNHVSVLHVAGDVELQDATRDLLVWLLEDDHAAAAQGFDRVQSIADICGRPMNGFDAAAAVASGEVAERVIADAVEQRLEAYRAAATELASNRIDPASLQHVPFTPARFAALAANVYANGCRHVAGECMHCQVRICIECREPLDLPSDAEIKTAVIWCREHVHLDPSRPGALPPGPREVWAPRDRLHSVSIDATGALTTERREELAASIERAAAEVRVADADPFVATPPRDTDSIAMRVRSYANLVVHGPTAGIDCSDMTDEQFAALSAAPTGFVAECQALIDRGTKPTLPEVKPLIDAYYAMPGNAVGGELHVVLDDHNYERRHIEWCVSHAERDETKVLGRVLLLMSNSQRRRM